MTNSGRRNRFYCLSASFTSAADVGAAHAYRFLPLRLLMKDQFRSDLQIARVTAPLLFLHGGRDWVVPDRTRRAALCARQRAQAVRALFPCRPRRGRNVRRAECGPGVSRASFAGSAPRVKAGHTVFMIYTVIII